jgi:hypothetical protein
VGLGTVAVLLLFSLGCAGTDSYVRARGPLDGPVSLSGGVYDADGRLLTLSHGLREVGQFKASRRVWSLFYFIRPGPWDVTKLVNRRLAETGGDAVIDLELTVRAAPYQGIAMFLVILPTYFNVYLKGTIVGATP